MQPDADAAPTPAAGDARPDYRYALSNVRTFLAWIRTALALLAAGVGVRQVAVPIALRHGRGLLSDLCVALAVALVALAYQRWRAGERAKRDGTLAWIRTHGTNGAGRSGAAAAAMPRWSTLREHAGRAVNAVGTLAVRTVLQ